MVELDATLGPLVGERMLVVTGAAHEDAVRAQLTALQPGGRLGTPADVAPVVAFLLSPAGRWVSGQLIKADGGFSA